MIDVLTAIKSINPNAEVSVGGNDINDITWLNGTAEIPKADIEARQQELQADYNSKEYQEALNELGDNPEDTVVRNLSIFEGS